MLVYDVHEQAEMRLRNTVITMDDRAALITRVREAGVRVPIRLDLTFYPLIIPDHNGRVVADFTGGNDGGPFERDNPLPNPPNKDIPKPDKLTVDIADERLNFRNFKLGYVNDPFNKVAHFLSRSTTRQQRQGLSRGVLNVEDATNGNHGVSRSLFFCKNFEDMLFERYPTLDEALRMIDKDNWASVAVGRWFAVKASRDMKTLKMLHYRGRTVGAVIANNMETSRFTLPPENHYLREILLEAGLPFTLDTGK